MNSVRRIRVTDLSNHKLVNNTLVTASEKGSAELEFVTPTKTAPRHGEVLIVTIAWGEEKN